MKKEQKQQLQQQTECCKSIEQQRHQQHKKVPARISCLEKCTANRNGKRQLELSSERNKKKTQCTKDQTTKYYRSCVHFV